MTRSACPCYALFVTFHLCTLPEPPALCVFNIPVHTQNISLPPPGSLPFPGISISLSPDDPVQLRHTQSSFPVTQLRLTQFSQLYLCEVHRSDIAFLLNFRITSFLAQFSIVFPR